MIRITTDLYPYYPTLTEFLERSCTTEWKIILTNTIYYGFRKGHSTQHAVLDIVNTIQTNMNQGLFSCGVFIDLKKAFDTVYHNILLNKRKHYGFGGIIKDWFSSYLNNRMQFTQIGL